ncbi:MAG: hypothetical protein L0Y44_10380 [Phycisphaerales bacterium]|nr:hypothetical protein [Phycisphaerales bacterium]MCI0631044.1 hypothetical protein [Phycisphaerales bacterium]MCI0675746.1 hypothetical protein [Phycisphaerales bacterium]
MHRIVVFDDGLGQLGPMTDLRASFEVRTGMYTTAGRIAALRPRMLAGYWAPERLAALVAERANAPVNRLPNEEIIHCVNGRWGIPDFSVALRTGEAMIEQSSGHVVCALLRRADAEYFLTTGQLHERVQRMEVAQRVLYRFPWDVLGCIAQTIPRDILTVRIAEAQIPGDVAAVVGSHPIEIHPTARVYPNVTLDAERGPIVIHERATVRPGAILCGPCSIGPDATIIDRAHIKANTVIGSWCKAGGEIGGTIFQGFSNKSHEGHLGDSWVGKWVNVGAGTTNSNLLNTYGEVVMRLEPSGPRLRTGMQFLGAIVGDHTKFAILTRIMTGTVIGTGSMIATTAPPPTCVPRFAWLTDEASQGRTYRLEKFIDVARTVMARRNVAASEAYLKAVRDLYDTMTRSMPSGIQPQTSSTP